MGRKATKINGESVTAYLSEQTRKQIEDLLFHFKTHSRSELITKLVNEAHISYLLEKRSNLTATIPL